jgi:DNA-binding transcriptional MerR regulator
MRTVGEVAQLAGATIRTLHHYDQIGLLSPSERSDAGYRLYSRSDLERLGATVRALDAALAACRDGTEIKETEMFEGFDHTEYAEEARERWGETEAYRESARRTASYGDAEWSEIRTEADAVERDFAALMEAGEPADGEPACAVAERHRQHITRWFYPVGPEMHRNLAEVYVLDQRFTAHYEDLALGLAGYVRDAIAANAAALDR